MDGLNRFIAAAIAGLALGAGGAATAATYDIDPQGPVSVFHDAAGANAWYVSVSRSLTTNGTTVQGAVAAGLFRLEEDRPGDDDRGFLAFCLSPGVWLDLNVDYAAGTGLGEGAIGALGALRRNAFDLVVDAVTAGAFQIAVWEIVSESGSYDLASGALTIGGTNGAAQGAISLASGWLTSIGSGAWAPTAAGLVFHDAQGSSQDLLEVAPVPLPASGLLLLGGVAAFAAAARHRRRA